MVHTVSAVIYYVQGLPLMFNKVRPYVILCNITTLIWFFAVQYFRFKPTGRACCGDYVDDMVSDVPDNLDNFYIGPEGTWLVYYVLSHYCVYILQKGVSIYITNKLASDYERKLMLVQNKV